MVFEADRFDRGCRTKLIDGAGDTVVPNAPSIVVVTGDVAARFDFGSEGLEIALHIVIEMARVDVRPIEVLIGEQGRGVVREHAMHHDSPCGDFALESAGHLLVLLFESCTRGVFGAELLSRTVVKGPVVTGEPGIDEMENFRLVDRQDALRKIAVENTDLDHRSAFRQRVEEKISTCGAPRSFGEQAFYPASTGKSGGRSVHGVYPLQGVSELDAEDRCSHLRHDLARIIA